MHDPLSVVSMLGARLRRERTGWRDAKALLLVVATAEHPVADLAAALGVVNDDMLQAVYEEARQRIIARHTETGGYTGDAAGCGPCAERRPHKVAVDLGVAMAASSPPP